MHSLSIILCQTINLYFFYCIFQSLNYKQIELMIHDAISGAIASFSLPSKGGYIDFNAQIKPEHVQLAQQSTTVSLIDITYFHLYSRNFALLFVVHCPLSDLNPLTVDTKSCRTVGRKQCSDSAKNDSIHSINLELV